MIFLPDEHEKGLPEVDAGLFGRLLIDQDLHGWLAGESDDAAAGLDACQVGGDGRDVQALCGGGYGAHATVQSAGDVDGIDAGRRRELLDG